MKQYKLVKEYPGSIKLGTIVYLETEDNYMTNIENDFRLFPKKIVENYPEFWEEVVEKDYEILEIKDKYGAVCSYIEELNHDLKDKTIFKVRRLSDGEIFTISDKVSNEYVNNYTINKICIVNDKCMVTALYDTNDPNGSRLHYNLNNIKKAKQPLFTTKDGVDIYEGNTIYGINNDWKVFSHYTDLQNKVKSWGIKPVFSTKEKAEEYILYNKPYLSLNDLKPWGDLLVNKLVELVKQQNNKK